MLTADFYRAAEDPARREDCADRAFKAAAIASNAAIDETTAAMQAFNSYVFGQLDAQQAKQLYPLAIRAFKAMREEGKKAADLDTAFYYYQYATR